MRGICHCQESFSDARRSAHYHFYADRVNRTLIRDRQRPLVRCPRAEEIAGKTGGEEDG